MRTIITFIIGAVPLVALILLFAAGCGSDAPGAGSEGPAVVATTTQVADLARNVAGERADVHGLLAPNTDPHDYEPRPSDAEALAGAGLILRSGGDVDAWIEGPISGSGTDATVVDLLASLPGADLGDEHARAGAGEEGHEHDHGDVDPHWWQDPRAAIAAVGEIRDALSAIDSEGAAEYEANADAYVAELERLDRAIARCVDSVPRDRRLLVTSHDALGRYAERYGIEVVGSAIPALTTAAQPSAGDTADLVELIERRGVKAVFPEAGLSPALEEAIADEAGATVGGELWTDALGPEGSSGATYVDAMEANTETLVRGFTGGEQRCDFSEVR